MTRLTAVDFAFILLVPFVILAAVDGLYFHLWRLRLHARPGSRREHALHTARAVLFVPALVLLYSRNRGGLLLWAAAVVLLADTVLEIVDAFEEPSSRRALGGMAPVESALHVALVALRAASIALLLAAKPVDAWHPAAPLELAPGYGAWQAFVDQGLLGGAIATALLHVWLLWRDGRAPAPSEDTAFPASDRMPAFGYR